MNDIRIDPVFAETFRETLVDTVSARRSSRRRRWWLGAGLVGVLAVAGAAGVATAELVRPPGAPIVASASDEITETFTGTGTIELGTPPEGANEIEYDVTCLSAGAFVYETGGSMSCVEAGTTERPAGHHPNRVPIPDDHAFTVTTAPEAIWSITVRYVVTRETEWGVNANGQTYGILKVDPEGMVLEPDLQTVYASNGLPGYAYTTDVNGPIADPSMPAFETAEEAAAWVMAHQKDRFPVYESDGVTVIGEMVIGQAPAVLAPEE